jgi:CRP-like cAMP-binding protein
MGMSFNGSTLPSNKLKDMCLKFIAARLRQSTMSEDETIQHMRLQKVRRNICIKMKSSFAAVLFASVLLHQRLVDMSKRLANRRCDAYKVLPGEHGVADTVGRALCVFPIFVPVMDDLLLFALDKRPNQAGHDEWVIFNIASSSAALILPSFEGHKQAPVQSVVICTYSTEGCQLVPMEVMAVEPQSGPHYAVIRHFEQQVAGAAATEASETLSPEGQSAFNALAEELSVQLPTREQLAVLPPSVRQAVLTLAKDVLHRTVYPPCVLRIRRKLRERISRGATSYALTGDVIGKLPEFDMWPPSILDELVPRLQPFGAERGENILYEGENPGSAIFFLVSGSVDVVQKLKPKIKSVGPGNSRLVATKGALSVFGYYGFITPYPRMSTVRAASSSCFMWRLSRRDFNELFAKLPAAVRSHSTDNSLARRSDSLRYSMPLSPQFLRKFGSLSALSDTVLKQLIPAFRAVSVPQGTVVARAEAEATVMHLLCRGHCAVYRTVEERGEELHVETIFEMTPIGDEAVIAGGSYVSTIRAKTCCDMYNILKEDFESVMRHNSSEWNAIVDVANKARQAKLQDSQYRFKDMAANIPILASLLPLSQRAELTRLFRPTLYHPRQVICSTAHFADKVIIVVEGQVRLQNGGSWEQGECSGYTCVVPHRWVMSAVAVTSSKLIELPRDVYVQYLRRHGVLETVKQCCQALMFPKAADPQQLYWALMATSKLKNPAMHPVSESPVVNMHEPKFGLKVTSYGQKHVRVIRKSFAVPTDLERSVETSMCSIADRVRRRRLVHPTSAGVEQAPDGASRWTQGKILLVTRHVEESRERSVSQHPMIVEYLARRRKPVGLFRPTSAQQGVL